MKSRRAGHGITSGVEPTAEQRDALRSQHTCMREASSMRCRGCNNGVPYPALTAEELGLAMFGDDPRIAAALRYAGEDVRAYEQTEAAWRAVWADDEREAG